MNTTITSRFYHRLATTTVGHMRAACANYQMNRWRRRMLRAMRSRSRQ